MMVTVTTVMSVARSVVTTVMTPMAPVSSISSVSISMMSMILALPLNKGQVIFVFRFSNLLSSLLFIYRQGSGESNKETNLNIEISNLYFRIY